MTEGLGHCYVKPERIDPVVLDIAETRYAQGADSAFDRFISDFIGEPGQRSRLTGRLACGTEVEYDFPLMSQCAADGTLIHLRVAQDAPIDDNDRYYVVTSDIRHGHVRHWRVVAREINPAEPLCTSVSYTETLFLVEAAEPGGDEPGVTNLRDQRAYLPAIELSSQRIDVHRPGQALETWVPVQSIQNQLALHADKIGQLLLGRHTAPEQAAG